jgi:hypothetical protein
MSMYMCPVLLILQSIEQERMAPIWHSCRHVEDSFWHTALQHQMKAKMSSNICIEPYGHWDCCALQD